MIDDTAHSLEPRFEIVDNRAGLAALKSDWNALFDRAGRPEQPFLTHGFASTWAEVYLDAGVRSSQRLAVLTVRASGRLVMVWPLVTERSLGLATLTWLGAPIAQYGDVLADDGPHTQALLRAAWMELQVRLKPDIIRLRKVRADAVVTSLLDQLDVVLTSEEEAASITLGDFEDRLPAKAKKNRRRLLRRLEEQATVAIRTPVEPAAAVEIATAGLALKRRWLAQRDIVSIAFRDRRIDSFFMAAAGPAAATTGCHVFALDVAGAPAAVAIGFAVKRRLTLHMIAYDLDYEKAGVGVLNLESVLRWAEAQDFEAVDLLAPKAAYKMDWADTAAPVADHTVALTALGHAAAHLYDGIIRPQAKRAIENAPALGRWLGLGAAA